MINPFSACDLYITAILGYDAFVSPNETHFYFTYGWNGVLSDAYRQKAAEAFYDAVIGLLEKLSARYPHQKIYFIIQGHSHGSNVVLYLAYWEQQKKLGLTIEHTVLYGAPIQMETALYATHPIFKNLMLLYSEGDTIQTGDFISTKQRKSYRCFSDILSLQELEQAPNHIFEILVEAEGNDKAFSHASFFHVGDQTNISLPVIHKLYPFPIVSFSPLFLNLIKNIKPTAYTTARLNFTLNQNNLTIELKQNDQCLATSPNFLLETQQITLLAKNYWVPFAVPDHHSMIKWAFEHLVKATTPFWYRKIQSSLFSSAS